MQNEQLQALLLDLKRNYDMFSAEEVAEIQSAVDHIAKQQQIELARTDFIQFAKICGPPWMKFSSKGTHHKIAKIFEDVVDGDLKYVTISLAPRMSKSEFGSILLPAWFIGKYPDKKVMQISATESLGTDFGRKVKGIIESPMYQRVFPGVRLAKDSKANGKFATNKGGEYFSLGITSNLAGKGGDLVVCLPHNESVFGLKKYKIGSLVNSGRKPLMITVGRNNLPCLRKVTQTFKHKASRMTTIMSEGSKMECTPCHPVWVEGRGYVEAETVQPGDIVVRMRSHAIVAIVATLLSPLLTLLECFARRNATSSTGEPIQKTSGVVKGVERKENITAPNLALNAAKPRILRIATSVESGMR